MTKIRRDLWTQRELPPPRRNPFPDILLPSGIPKAWQKQSSGCQNVPLCATKQAAEVSALTQQKKKKKGGKFKQPIKLLHKFRLDKTPGPYTGTSHRKNSVRGARHGMFFFFSYLLRGMEECAANPLWCEPHSEAVYVQSRRQRNTQEGPSRNTR